MSHVAFSRYNEVNGIYFWCTLHHSGGRYYGDAGASKDGKQLEYHDISALDDAERKWCQLKSKYERSADGEKTIDQ